MKLHERTLPVQRAENELGTLVWQWIERHDLTYTEAVRCLLSITQGVTKYQLRQERHPDDPDTKADEAADQS